MTGDELKEFYYDELHWCGCGDPFAALSFLGEVLEAIENRHGPDAKVFGKELSDEDRAGYALPLDLIGMGSNPGLAYGYLYSLDAYGLIEHGSTIRGCWLTSKGVEVMSAIKTMTPEEWGKL